MDSREDFEDKILREMDAVNKELDEIRVHWSDLKQELAKTRAELVEMTRQRDKLKASLRGELHHTGGLAWPIVDKFVDSLLKKSEH